MSSLEVEDKAAFDDAFLDLVRVGLRVRVYGAGRLERDAHAQVNIVGGFDGEVIIVLWLGEWR